MEAAIIDITASNEDQATAIAAAVNSGLSAAGFTNVESNISTVAEPVTLLDSLRQSYPSVFEAPVQVSASWSEDTVPEGELIDEEETVAD